MNSDLERSTSKRYSSQLVEKVHQMLGFF